MCPVDNIHVKYRDTQSVEGVNRGYPADIPDKKIKS